MNNLYIPKLVNITNIIDETPDVRTFKLQFVEDNIQSQFKFNAGQFGEFSAFGYGECTFCLASPPSYTDHFEISFKLVGKVTSALNKLEINDQIGFRGPYGNCFPFEKMIGKNLLFIGGGIGMAPVRSIFEYCLFNRQQFGSIKLLNGARTVNDIVYKKQSVDWNEYPDVEVVLTVDPGGETKQWNHEIGLIPTILEKAKPSAENAIVVMCGPPVMIKFTLLTLLKLGFNQQDIYTTLENRMKCGIGKCGRCNVGPIYVCKDGPVFSAAEIRKFLPDM